MKRFLIFVILGLSLFTPLYFNVAHKASAVDYVEKVAFNTKSYKVHKLSCHWAKKCTVNCILLKRKDAYARGGIPCKVCGG